MLHFIINVTFGRTLIFVHYGPCYYGVFVVYNGILFKAEMVIQKKILLQ